jgi:hypothetical protein
MIPFLGRKAAFETLKPLREIPVDWCRNSISARARSLTRRPELNHAKFFSRSHDAMIHVYDEAGNVIETHEHAGEFKEW